MTACISGEQWSEGWTSDVHWSFADLIAYISESGTLMPGDFLGSGACGTGCGLELDRWIQPGDVVELSVEGLGTLRNRVVADFGPAATPPGTDGGRRAAATARLRQAVKAGGRQS